MFPSWKVCLLSGESHLYRGCAGLLCLDNYADDNDHFKVYHWHHFAARSVPSSKERWLSLRRIKTMRGHFHHYSHSHQSNQLYNTSRSHIEIYCSTDDKESHRNKKSISNGQAVYDTVSDHLESLSTSVPEILTAGRLNGQCSGLYG